MQVDGAFLILNFILVQYAESLSSLYALYLNPILFQCYLLV